jgi:flagellar biosynthesis protein FliQ
MIKKRAAFFMVCFSSLEFTLSKIISIATTLSFFLPWVAFALVGFIQLMPRLLC